MENELTAAISGVELTPAEASGLTGMVAEMLLAMRSMADMTRATNERVAELERQLRLQIKIPRGLENELMRQIRARAAELCEEYELLGCDAKMAAAIRRDVKRDSGISAMRDLPRCDYMVMVERIALWDDYETIKRLRQGGGRGNG